MEENAVSLDEIEEFQSFSSSPVGPKSISVPNLSENNISLQVNHIVSTSIVPSLPYLDRCPPNSSPSADFFADALVDKQKETVVIQYMKSRFSPAIHMMMMVSEVQGMGFKNEEDDLIRMLIKTAVTNPNAFKFECREVVEST